GFASATGAPRIGAGVRAPHQWSHAPFRRAPAPGPRPCAGLGPWARAATPGMNRHMTETPATPQVITVRMPSRLDMLGELDHVAQCLCERLKFDSEACTQISMSLIEAGTNAIQHGHHRDASKPVDTTFTVFPDRLEISVHDLGSGFKLEEVNGNVTSPEHILDP